MTSVRTFLIEPFDIMLHATEEGVQSLQARFSTWLRTLREPARFVCWQMPATLNDKISSLSRKAQEVDDGQRRALLMEYRRHFESLMHPDLTRCQKFARPQMSPWKPSCCWFA